MNAVTHTSFIPALDRNVYDRRPMLDAMLVRCAEDGRDPLTLVEIVYALRHREIQCFGYPVIDPRFGHLLGYAPYTAPRPTYTHVGRVNGRGAVVPPNEVLHVGDLVFQDLPV